MSTTKVFTLYSVSCLCYLFSLLVQNMKLNDSRIIIFLIESEVFVERRSVCNVTVKLAEHGIHSNTNNVLDLLLQQP